MLLAPDHRTSFDQDLRTAHHELGFILFVLEIQAGPVAVESKTEVAASRIRH